MVESKKHYILHKLYIGKKMSLRFLFVILIAVLTGLFGTLFGKGISFVTKLRMEHPWFIFLLPFGGLFIVGSYRLLRNENDAGINQILSAIHSGEKIPMQKALLIVVSTWMTHLFGGSAGRIGASLQLGGTLGSGIGHLFGVDENERRVFTMCGMSGAFSAVFGVPLAAAIFPLEMSYSGVLYHSALAPCVLSSLISYFTATSLGCNPEYFPVFGIPAFSLGSAVLIAFFSVLCAFVGICFCIVMQETASAAGRLMTNPYVRIFAGGSIVVVLTLLVGSQTFNGGGLNQIPGFMANPIRPETFLLKIVFTAITLGTGYKGGEIAPTLFIGAAFGSLFGNFN